MIYGNWVAIRKVFVKFLPDDRPYNEFEAVFSVSLDFDSGNPASYSGYSKLWKWSRNKVKRFMNNDLELTILKPETPEEIRLQKGKINGHPKGHLQDNLDDKKGQPLFVFNKALYEAKDNLDDKKGQPQDNLKDTTIDPTIILNPTTIKKIPKKKVVKVEKPENVTDQTWDDWKKHRSKRKSIITENVIKGFTKQAELAGYSLENAIKESIERGWTGFKAEWMKNSIVNSKNLSVSDHNQQHMDNLKTKIQNNQNGPKELEHDELSERF